MKITKLISHLSQKDLVIFIPILIFVYLTWGFWGEPPFFDPMVIYRESTMFFSGGVQEIIANGVRIHPPLIYVINSVLFLIFGKSPFTYNLAGFLIYSFDVVLVYFVLKKVFNYQTAVLSIFLVFLNPLIIINSFFLANDMLLVTVIITILYGLVYEKYLLLSASLFTAVFMKETGLAIILATLYLVLSINFLKEGNLKNKFQSLVQTSIIFAPSLVGFLGWSFYLRTLGTGEWKETIFVTDDRSSFQVVLDNLAHLNFGTIFMSQNLFNGFVMNWQWLYSGLALILTFGLLLLRVKFLKNGHQQRFFWSALAIMAFFIVLVFSFPTWTVPRYGLPVILITDLILGTALAAVLEGLHKKISLNLNIGLASLAILVVVGGFVANQNSWDPVTRRLGDNYIRGVNFYNLNFWNSGPDRILYNTQSFVLLEDQNKLIKKAIQRKADVIVTYCDEGKLGEKTYSIGVHNQFYPDMKLSKPLDCINDYLVSDPDLKGKMTDKIILVRLEERQKVKNLLTEAGIRVKEIVF